MKTHNYNPSIFETELAQAILACQGQIQQQLKDVKIISTTAQLQLDNPQLIFQLQDQDGDPHEVVVKLIQRPDRT